LTQTSSSSGAHNNNNNNNNNNNDNDKTTLGERLMGTSGDLREMSYLSQRLSVNVQRFNSVLIHESFVSADEELDL